MEGVGVVHVGVDAPQQVQGVALPVVRLPQQAQGTGVLLVVQVENQAVGHGGGLQQGAGLLQAQAGAVAGQGAHRGHELLRPRLNAGEGVGGRLLVQGVDHAAPGGVDDQTLLSGGAGLHLQQGQLVGHHLGHGVQLLRGHGLAVLGVDLIPKQPQGVAVGQHAVGPGGERLRLRGGFGGKGRLGAAQQAKGQQQADEFLFHIHLPFSGSPKFFWNDTFIVAVGGGKSNKDFLKNSWTLSYSDERPQRAGECSPALGVRRKHKKRCRALPQHRLAFLHADARPNAHPPPCNGKERWV